jgi:hypothetical protein
MSAGFYQIATSDSPSRPYRVEGYTFGEHDGVIRAYSAGEDVKVRIYRVTVFDTLEKKVEQYVEEIFVARWDDMPVCFVSCERGEDAERIATKHVVNIPQWKNPASASDRINVSRINVKLLNNDYSVFLGYAHMNHLSRIKSLKQELSVAEHRYAEFLGTLYKGSQNTSFCGDEYPDDHYVCKGCGGKTNQNDQHLEYHEYYCEYFIRRAKIRSLLPKND